MTRAGELRVAARVCGAARALERDDAAVIGTDESGTVVYWGPGAERLYGWAASEVLGNNVVDVTPALQSREEATHIMTELARGRAWSGSFVVRHKDGSAILADVADTPVMAGGVVVGVVGVSQQSRRMRTPRGSPAVEG